ncbi:MAG: Smr/MutS family protein [Chloroflexota bacterium]
MNPRALKVLEYDKILERLARHCSFSGGSDLAAALLPSDDLQTIQEWLEQTDEAYNLLEQKADISFGGVTDVRHHLEKAERRSMLLAPDLLEIRNTLMRARNLQQLIVRLEHAFPQLATLAYNIETCDHVVTDIGRCISDRAEVVDNASPELAQIRQELRIAQERLLTILDRLVHNPNVGPFLQDSLVTQRQGRYVIPVRAEHKGQIDGIIHDQSSSGATLFVEPIKVVQQNNAVRELELREDKEVRRILTHLTELIADEAHYIRDNVHILAQLDLIFAKAKYAYQIDATLPTVVPFHKYHKPIRGTELTPASPNGASYDAHRQDRNQGDVQRQETAQDQEGISATIPTSDPVVHPGSVIDLRRARHPLLDPEEVVPIDVYLDDTYYIIVVTGPNTGGKTVTLKTVGLLALMAQSGMMIPTEPDSQLSVFEGIYSDIGDEQSIEQSLSTFSSHMTNIIQILEEADPRSLVLFDELGAGTDPDEGSALAMALLENLRDRGITTVATTHYSDLKLYAHSTVGVRNASVEFDIQTLSPTYELSIGLPGRSNALTIARRLGLNPSIVDSAENIVRPDTLQADSLLDEIKQARQEARRFEERAKEREKQAQVLERDLRYQLASIEEARRNVIAEMRSTMQAEIDQAIKEIEQTRRQLSRTGQPQSGTAHKDFLARAEAELTRRRTDSSVDRNVVVPDEAGETITGPIEVGDKVWVPSLQATGVILTINAKDEEADVQLGNFRLKLPLKRLELRQKAQKDKIPEQVRIRRVSGGEKRKSPGMELDLRGARIEDGLDEVETYLDDAFNGQLPFVRIIHGKGTGALRDAVRNLLKGHPLVSRYRAGDGGEGGDGVTIAHLMEGG